MERTIHSAVLFVPIFVSYMLLAACGGGGQGDTSSTEVAVEGSWSGTYAPPGASAAAPVYALIRKDGAALFYGDDGVVYRLPRLNGAYSFSGHVTAYAPIGYQFTDSGRSAEIEGTAADSEITADLKTAQGTGTLDLSPFDMPQHEPAVHPGQWMGYYISPTPSFVGLTISPSGAITGDDVFGCHLVGHIVQVQPGENLFDVAVVTTGPGPVCGTTFTGLAHQTDYDTFGYFKNAPGTYYYLGLIGAGRAFAAELKVQ